LGLCYDDFHGGGAADFVAPLDHMILRANGSLLPPTQNYWRNSARQFTIFIPIQDQPGVGEAGDLELIIKPYKKPAWFRLFCTSGSGMLLPLEFACPQL